MHRCPFETAINEYTLTDILYHNISKISRWNPVIRMINVTKLRKGLVTLTPPINKTMQSQTAYRTYTICSAEFSWWWTDMGASLCSGRWSGFQFLLPGYDRNQRRCSVMLLYERTLWGICVTGWNSISGNFHADYEDQDLLHVQRVSKRKSALIKIVFLSLLQEKSILHIVFVILSQGNSWWFVWTARSFLVFEVSVQMVLFPFW